VAVEIFFKSLIQLPSQILILKFLRETRYFPKSARGSLADLRLFGNFRVVVFCFSNQLVADSRHLRDSRKTKVVGLFVPPLADNRPSYQLRFGYVGKNRTR